MTEKILEIISSETIYSYNGVKYLYDLTKSFDETIALIELGCGLAVGAGWLYDQINLARRGIAE